MFHLPEFLLTGDRKVYIEVDVSDLDDAITKFLRSKNYSEKNFNKFGYESVAVNCWCNNQSHNFNVEPIMPSAADLEDIDMLCTYEILNWMCFENEIEAADYLVRCSW